MGITEERIKRITEQAAAMKAIGKASVDVSVELEALASDNAAMEAEIQGLEEANARLRQRLNRGENHEAYMKLPLDADGEPIRIGDTVYTRDAEEYIVRGIYALADGYSISVVPLSRTCFLPMKPEGLTHRTTDSADSWEKLEEDAAKEVCAYAGASFSIVDQDRYSCTGCRFDDCSNRKASCWLQMNSELMARAKRLAGAE